MKVSYNWIQDYLDFPLPPVDELVKKIGAQLGAVESVTDLGVQYKGNIIAKIVSCEPLEGSDHLNVCLIDDGGAAKDVERNSDGLVQVVCGAPNARAGILVAWLPPGATVPSTVGKNPYVLEARKLRGAMSNGMLASPKELAIGDSHEGILEIDYEVLPGADFAETYKLNDYIIDIENKMFTHRPDCFGQLGVAREIAGILGKPFTSPEWYRQPQQNLTTYGSELKLAVKNEVPELVPRFMALAISNVEIGPSSVWMQTFLNRVGIRPINNIVDVTNYYMMLTGQPLHAYDYDKVRALDGGDTATLVARKPRDSERLTLLNGKTIDPRQDAILIATETTPVGLGGVMGGADTEVSDDTKNIILECATFDMYSIRRTSMAHGIFSDAVTRFNKGQSPLQNPAVLLQAAHDMVTGTAEYASNVIDIHNLPDGTAGRGSLHPTVSVTTEYINSRLGLSLNAEEMTQLLKNVECSVDTDGDTLHITTPFWRTDIELREDIVEEVGRLFGFDSLPLQLPHRTVTPIVADPLLQTKSLIRTVLSGFGANEALTYSFVHGKLLEATGQDGSLAFRLNNALSPDLQYYRISLLPSLLDKVHANIKNGYDEFALFELGKGHTTLHQDDDADGLPKEFDMLAFVYSAHDKLKKQGAAFYQAKHYAESLLAELGIAVTVEPIDEMPDVPIVKPYAQQRAGYVYEAESREFLGIIGELAPAIRRHLKLPAHTAGFELHLEPITRLMNSVKRYQPLSRYPSVEQDICLRVTVAQPYGELLTLVRDTLQTHVPSEAVFDLQPVDVYAREDDSEHKQVTFRVRVTHYARTLTDKEVTGLLDRVAEAAAENFSATRI